MANRVVVPLLLCGLLLGGCGGGGGGVAASPDSGTMGRTDTVTPVPVAPVSPGTPVAPVSPAVILPPPVLSFNDTGVSISDGVTSNGRWSVSSPLDGLGWEFSLDMGRTWIRGEGGSFEVTGDGRKSIWVRTFDHLGNTSEIVMTACTLDTTPPLPPRPETGGSGGLPTVRVEGLESMATWEYSLDEQLTWAPGRGTALVFAGNAIGRGWWRQRDVAGNPSVAVVTAIDDPASAGWLEASGDALSPSRLPAWQGTLVLHGSIMRGDTDFVRFDVPAGQRLRGLRLAHYASPDRIAFYALQRGPVFDAGTDVQRMLAWKHLGPDDRLVELTAPIDPQFLGAGSFTLWVNQTGRDATVYALEIEIGPG